MATSSSSRSLGSTRGSIQFTSLEVLLKGPVGLILPAVCSVVGGMCAPMFPVERAMLLSAAFLWNPVVEGDHLRF